MFLSLLHFKGQLKQFNIFSPPTRTLFHLGKRFWFFVSKGKGERTNVLKEGKGGVDHLKASLGEDFILREKNNLGYKFYNEQGRETKEEGEGREGRKRGVREEEAIFEIRADGKSWAYKNLVLETWGDFGFIVYIKGTEGEWEELDTTVCYSPNILAMFHLLNYLVGGRRPLFTAVAIPESL